MAFIKICKASEIAEGVAKAYGTRYGRIALTRLDGQVCAFQDLCTHDDGPLAEGKIEGGEIVCPRHGARFDIRTGRVTRMPATEDIEVYPVRITGEDVEIEMD